MELSSPVSGHQTTTTLASHLACLVYLLGHIHDNYNMHISKTLIVVEIRHTVIRHIVIMDKILLL